MKIENMHTVHVYNLNILLLALLSEMFWLMASLDSSSSALL